MEIGVRTERLNDLLMITESVALPGAGLGSLTPQKVLNRHAALAATACLQFC